MDLKPANFLISPTGYLKIAEFVSPESSLERKIASTTTRLLQGQVLTCPPYTYDACICIFAIWEFVQSANCTVFYRYSSIIYFGFCSGERGLHL